MSMLSTDVELFDTTGLWTPVEFEQDLFEHLASAYRHEDGSITYIVYDQDCRYADPRDCDGNVATLIRNDDDYGDLDEDHAGLREARERWGSTREYQTHPKMQRYLSIFRPDIVHYCNYWSASGSMQSHWTSGWGYVTRAAWETAMYLPKPAATDVDSMQAWLEQEPSCTPEEAFDQEVKVYEMFFAGEVFGYHHVEPDGTEDSCWGFLAMSHEDIAAEASSSPVSDVLW